VDRKKDVKPADNQANQSASRGSLSKRRLLGQQQQCVHVCEQIEELSIVFYGQTSVCMQMDVPVALVLVEIANFDDLKTANHNAAGVLVNEIAHQLLSAVRGHDVIAQYNGRYIAILLVDADQIVGGKVCQRIKECIHKYSYLHKGGGSIELHFGVSDDSEGKYTEIEKMIFSAAQALNVAHQLGDGVIVRVSDLDPVKEISPREHFFPGDRLTSKTV